MRAPDSQFDSLCDRWIVAKAAEAKASADRRVLEEQLMAYLDNNKTGTQHIQGNNYALTAKIESEAISRSDFIKLYETIPPSVRELILIPGYKFSKTGLNLAIKQLTFRAVRDSSALEELEALNKAIESDIEYKASKPYFSIKHI